MSQKSYDKSPTLYLIPTPIGNLEDITLRAIKILEEVEVIFSEDTRVTLQLLNHLKIKKKLIASHEHNEQQNRQKLISYLQAGYNVGLVTDRGTPIISDPGYALVQEAIEKQYNVVGLPGATAFVPALIVSGLCPQPFLFYGFLNNKETKRKKELQNLKNVSTTLIFYEAPHRIEKTLQDILEIMGDRQISISREISKKYEEIYRGMVTEVSRQIVDAKGEMVLVVSGDLERENYDNLTIVDHVNHYVKLGNTPNEAIKLVARERGTTKKAIYDEYHHLGKDEEK